VRGEDWLLHGTSRAEAAKAYVSSTAVKSDDSPVTDTVLTTGDRLPKWTKAPTGAKFEKISSALGCAQVEPRELCQWLEEQCRENGVEFYLNTQPTGLVKDDQGTVCAIRVETCKFGNMRSRYDIPCKDIIISAGCWTPLVFKTLLRQKMSPGIKPLPGYSCVVRSQKFSNPIFEALDDDKNVEMVHATFCPPTSKWSYSPECMARHTKGGKPEIYVAGLNDETIILPERASHAKHLMERSKLDDLRKTAEELVRGNRSEEDIGDKLELVREGLCFRPVSESGLPIISVVAGIELQHNGHLYVASGHGPWGITLSLGTGVVVSELLEGIKHRVLTKELDLVTRPVAIRARL